MSTNAVPVIKIVYFTSLKKYCSNVFEYLIIEEINDNV